MNLSANDPEAKSPIAVFGDWHGDQGWGILAIRSAAREGVKAMIHIGDFAWIGPARSGAAWSSG